MAASQVYLPFQQTFSDNVSGVLLMLIAIFCRPTPRQSWTSEARRDFTPAIFGRCLEAGFRWPLAATRVCGFIARRHLLPQGACFQREIEKKRKNKSRQYTAAHAQTLGCDIRFVSSLAHAHRPELLKSII